MLKFDLPDLGEGITEAVIVRIPVEPGDTVKQDQTLMEVETEKAAVEIPSPYNATILAVHVKEGDIVPVGTTLMSFIPAKTHRPILDEELGEVRKGLRNLQIMVAADELPSKSSIGISFAWYKKYLEQAWMFAHQPWDLQRLNLEEIRTMQTCLLTMWIPIERIRMLKKERDTSKVKYQEIRKNVDKRREFLSDLQGECLHNVERSNEPYIFIGSSTESLSFARKIHEYLNLDDHIKPRIHAKLWIETSELKEFGKYPMEALNKILRKFDCGVFVFGADDKLEERGVELIAPRDNVIFEYGLFVGRFGLDWGFVIQDERSKMLSDLKAVFTARYDGSEPKRNWEAALSTACSQVKEQLRERWRSRKRPTRR